MATGETPQPPIESRERFWANSADGLLLGAYGGIGTLMGLVFGSMIWAWILSPWLKPRNPYGPRAPIQEIVFGLILGIAFYLFRSRLTPRKNRTIGQRARGLALVGEDGAAATSSQFNRWWLVRHAVLLVILIHLSIHLYLCFTVHWIAVIETRDTDIASEWLGWISAGVCGLLVLANALSIRAGLTLAERASGLRMVRVAEAEPEYGPDGGVKPAPLGWQISAALIDLFLSASGPLLLILTVVARIDRMYEYPFLRNALIVVVYGFPFAVVASELFAGRSPGHFLLRMRIHARRGGRADFGRRAIRFGFRRSIEIAMVVVIALMLLGESMRLYRYDWLQYCIVAGWVSALASFVLSGIVLLCGSGRGLHDRIAGTTLCREQDVPSDAEAFRGFQPVMGEASAPAMVEAIDEP